MTRVGREPRGGTDGFGLVEVVLSIFVLLVVLVATTYVVDTTVKEAAINRQKVAAAELAEQYLETLTNTSLANLQADISRDVLLTATPVIIGNTAYSVWSHLEWATTGTPSNLCSSGSPPEIIRATVTVKWGTGIQAESLGETSVINPPYGTVISGDGFLSIQIAGANPNAAPSDTANLINVVVSVTDESTSPSPTTTTYNPDKNGCVYLQEPAGDKFDVSLASPSGGPAFMDSWNQTTAPSTTMPSSETLVGGGTVTVVSAGIAYDSPKFHYDEAGTVTFTPQAGPIAGNMPISVSTGGQPMVVVPWTGTGTNGVSANASTAPLFPTYQTPYSVWYGDCATVSGPNAEAPSAPTTFSLAPEGTASAVIAGLDTLPLAVTSPSSNLSAKAVVADPNTNDGCTSSNGESYTLAGFSGTGPTYSDSTQIIPQTYSVTVTDNSDGKSTTTTMVVGANGVTVGATLYATGQAVPVTVL